MDYIYDDKKLEKAVESSLRRACVYAEKEAERRIASSMRVLFMADGRRPRIEVSYIDRNEKWFCVRKSLVDIVCHSLEIGVLGSDGCERAVSELRAIADHIESLGTGKDGS